MNMVCLAGIFGNPITLFVITKRKIFANRNNFDVFMSNLAVVDIMACIFATVIGAKYIDPYIMQYEFACVGNLLVSCLIRHLALLSLTLLTLNRYYTVVKTNASVRLFNKRRSWWYVFLVWGLAILVMVLIFISSETSSSLSITNACGIVKALSEKLKQPALFQSLHIFINLAILSFCSVRIWQFVRSHN